MKRIQQEEYLEYGTPGWKRLILRREAIIFALLVLVIIAAIITTPAFASTKTVTYLLLDTAAIMMMAFPMTLVMITGDIDLSVGSMVGLSSATLGLLLVNGMPFIVAGLAALCVGVLGGLFNGLLVTRVGLPALAVTIGTMALYRGIGKGMLGTLAVTEFPKEWTDLAKATIGSTGIPVVVIVLLVMMAIFIVLLHFTSFGRGVYAIGLSKEAALFSGVRVERTRLILFVISGFIAALAGIYFTLRYTSARADTGTGLELQVIAAVVLGGVSVFGGVGAIAGSVAGVLLIGVLAQTLRLHSITSDVISIVTGVLLILSVTVGSLALWVQKKRSQTKARAEAAKG
ncbi:ABC transporter permease [Actinomycetaceae bacterium WB03_NA08]|uniref:Autoinducer 2 import system permease protein LsrD n=2 Tax=Scrofimicrobium canadense TaxID=2652290 RepID=A0A6N7VTV3_9ACTO|nr:ABC transporter permease [Scrofimicrobium canadense]